MFRFCALLTLCLVCPLVVSLDDDDTQDHWDSFKDKYNKTYDTPEEEEQARDNFESNLLHVALHNLEDEHDYDKNVHEYSDMTVEQQIEALCQTEVPADVSKRELEDFSTSERQLPSSVDWVAAGKVRPVKNQGSCGSCWTFSAAQAVESAYDIKYNKQVVLSEQQLVDCAGDYGNNGCNGGWPQSAFEYVQNEGGLVDDTCYPYTGEEDTCDVDSSCKHYKITGYKNVGPEGDEAAVAKALSEKGPLTCALYVSNDMMHYSGGVFTDKTYRNQDVNHGVLLTGYGTENGVSYWTIKNSWGSSWGENGYIRVIRGDPKHKNHLKICSYTSYPIVA